MKRPLEHSTPVPNSAPESVATLHLIACHQAHLGEQLLRAWGWQVVPRKQPRASLTMIGMWGTRLTRGFPGALGSAKVSGNHMTALPAH